MENELLAKMDAPLPPPDPVTIPKKAKDGGRAFELGLSLYFGQGMPVDKIEALAALEAARQAGASYIDRETSKIYLREGALLLIPAISALAAAANDGDAFAKDLVAKIRLILKASRS